MQTNLSGFNTKEQGSNLNINNTGTNDRKFDIDYIDCINIEMEKKQIEVCCEYQKMISV